MAQGIVVRLIRAVNFYAGVFDDSEGNRLALHSEA